MTRPERISHYVTGISELLGLGSSRVIVITSCLLAVLSIIYALKIALYFNWTIYIFIDRVTYIGTFQNIILDGYYYNIAILSVTFACLILAVSSPKVRIGTAAVYGILLIVAVSANFTVISDILSLISLPLIVSCILYEKKSASTSFPERSKVSVYFSVNLTLKYIAIVLAVASGVSLFISSVRILFGNVLPLQHDYAYMIFLVFASFSPFFIILLSFCFPVKLLMNELTVAIRKIIKQKTTSFFSNQLPPERHRTMLTRETKLNIKASTRVLCLSSIILLSIIIAIIPHQITINPDSKPIGSDTHYYVRWITILLTQTASPYEFFDKLFVELVGGDRPLTLLLLAVLTKITNTAPFYVVEFFPLFLGPSLVLVIYFLTRELTSDEFASLLAAFLTASASFHLLVGLYAGFYANWLALIPGYSSIVFLFRGLREGRRKDLVAFSLLLVLSQFIHIYTWSILALVIGIFLGTCIVFHHYPKKRVIILLLLLASSVVIDLAKTVVIGSLGGIARDLQVAETSIGAEQFASRWYNLINTVQLHYGSIFSNFIILVLGLYWLLRSNLRYVPSNLFLAVFLSIGILPIFIGDWVVQSRVFYNIPFQIPAAIAITLLISQQTSRIAILLPVCGWVLAISIRTAANLYEVLPT